MLELVTAYSSTTLENVLVKRDSSTSDTGTTSTGMPKLKTTSSSSSSYSTPSVTVPPNNNNPYLIRENHPSGTVFIAVGAILGAIIIAFTLYHIIRSLLASKTAKKNSSNYEKLGNNSAYGGSVTPGSTLNLNEYQQSVTRIPLINHQRSRSGLSGLGGLGGGNLNGSQTDSSTVYGSEAAASKHDVTKMFISPTAEVMRHKRTKSQFSGSTTTLNTSAPFNTMSQIPNLYINEENNSDYSLATRSTNTNTNTNTSQTRDSKRTPRKTIPSMYLEDLIDKE